MRQIHHEASRDDSEVVAAPNQVVQPGDFVEAVVHETLVELGKHARSLDHHVGLLNRVEPARNQRVMKRAVRKKPFLVKIVLRQRQGADLRALISFRGRGSSSGSSGIE